MDEKLEFSLEDLGRLARFMFNRRDSHPFDVVFEWLRLQIHNPDQLRETFNKFTEGYYKELESE